MTKQQAFARRVLIDGVLVSPVGRHGSASTYCNHGCRCRPCTTAWSVKNSSLRQQRRAKTAANGGVAPVDSHGSPSTFSNWGCRCGECLAAWNTARSLWSGASRKKQAERRKVERRQARVGRACRQCSGPIDPVRTAKAVYCGMCARTRKILARLDAGVAPHPPYNSPFRVLARSCLKCGRLLVTPQSKIMKASSGRLPPCPTCFSKKPSRRRVAERQREQRRELSRAAVAVNDLHD